MIRIVAALLLLLASLPALAIRPDEILQDPALEARARALGKELRCLVCQNQSIDDSDATLARDLRLLVRERLVAGDTDAAVRRFLVDRYGDFVRLNPPFRATTLMLWIGPVIVLGLGIVAIVVTLRRRQAEAPAVLDAEERQRLSRVLAEDEKR
jgi:cytochrome c-type biogenesis protein CcmH